MRHLKWNNTNCISSAAPTKITSFSSADVASIVISSGAVIVGETLSVTVTVCVACTELPAASVAVHVIVVSPTG